ncbi:MAG: toxin-antitoxin system YwqK family antitoxin [Flavobacteriales bacterium]
MKAIFYFLTLCICIGCDHAGKSIPEQTDKKEPDTCSCTALILDETYNHKYLYERTKPYTGVCIDKFPNGNFKMERHYKDGKVHGLFREWHINGTQKNEAFFEMNLQNGKATVWDDAGSIIYQADYTRGAVDTVYILIPSAFD